MISLPWFVWAGVRLFAPEVYAAETDISREKRSKNELNLKELVKSGENLSLYINDRVPFRGSMIDLYQSTEGKTEKAYQNIMRKLSTVFTGKGPEQKEVVDVGSMLGTPDDSSADVSADETDNNPAPEEDVSATEGLDHEHSLTVIETVEPTCENAGYTLYKCDNCDYTYKDIVPPKGHDFVLIKETQASYESYGYKLYQCRVCAGFKMEDFEGKYVDTSYMAPRTVGGTMLGRYNWLFYASDPDMKYYTGTNLLSDSKLAEYNALVKRLKEVCNARGIAPFIMFMPNKEQVYSEYMPTMEIADNYKRTQRLTDYLNANSGVDVIYPIEELKTADVYWQTYYKYDSHWNHMGAFIGLQKFYKYIGVATVNPWLLGPYTITADRADLIDIGGLSRENYPDDYEVMPNYHPEVNVEGLNQYADICHTYAGNAPYNCKLVVLSDSYREMMTPFMAKDFTDLVVAHRDFTDQCADDIRNCNILLITAVERDDELAFKCIEKVISILEQ